MKCPRNKVNTVIFGAFSEPRAVQVFYNLYFVGVKIRRDVFQTDEMLSIGQHPASIQTLTKLQ